MVRCRGVCKSLSPIWAQEIVARPWEEPSQPQATGPRLLLSRSQPINVRTPTSLLHMYDPDWPSGFSVPGTSCRQAIAPASEGREHISSTGPFPKAHLKQTPACRLPGSQAPSSFTILRDRWQQTRPHENFKGIPALQKHQEKRQSVLPLPGLPAAWVSALLGFSEMNA